MHNCSSLALMQLWWTNFWACCIRFSFQNDHSNSTLNLNCGNNAAPFDTLFCVDQSLIFKFLVYFFLDTMITSVISLIHNYVKPFDILFCFAQSLIRFSLALIFRNLAERKHAWYLSRIPRIYFTDLTRKIGVFQCKFYSPKILPV